MSILLKIYYQPRMGENEGDHAKQIPPPDFGIAPIGNQTKINYRIANTSNLE